MATVGRNPFPEHSISSPIAFVYRRSTARQPRPSWISPQAETFLQGRENRRSIGQIARILVVRDRPVRFRAAVVRPSQPEIVEALEARFVDHGPVHRYGRASQLSAPLMRIRTGLVAIESDLSSSFVCRLLQFRRFLDTTAGKLAATINPKTAVARRRQVSDPSGRSTAAQFSQRVTTAIAADNCG